MRDDANLSRAPRHGSRAIFSDVCPALPARCRAQRSDDIALNENRYVIAQPYPAEITDLIGDELNERVLIHRGKAVRHPGKDVEERLVLVHWVRKAHLFSVRLGRTGQGGHSSA